MTHCSHPFTSVLLAFLWMVSSSATMPPLSLTTTRLSTDMRMASRSWPMPSPMTTPRPRRKSCSILRPASWTTCWASLTSRRSRSSSSSWCRFVLHHHGKHCLSVNSRIYHWNSYHPFYGQVTFNKLIAHEQIACSVWGLNELFQQYFCWLELYLVKRKSVAGQEPKEMKHLIFSFKYVLSYLTNTVLARAAAGSKSPSSKVNPGRHTHPSGAVGLWGSGWWHQWTAICLFITPWVPRPRLIGHHGHQKVLGTWG